MRRKFARCRGCARGHHHREHCRAINASLPGSTPQSTELKMQPGWSGAECGINNWQIAFIDLNSNSFAQMN